MTDKLVSDAIDVTLDDKESDTNEFENNSAYNTQPVPKKLFIAKSDRSISDLVTMLDNKILDLQPDYQRKFIWSKVKSSKFIESLLLGIPVPTLFFAETGINNTLEVIDGQQRLTSVAEFMKNSYKLRGLENLSEFNNKQFSDLDSNIQNTLKYNVTMYVVTIKHESSPEIKFDVFQRINEGAVKLNAQELRNVIYRGKLIDATNKIVENSFLKSIFSENSLSQLRYIPQEMLIRMIAIDSYVEEGGDNRIRLSSQYNGRINDAITKLFEEHRNDIEYVNEITIEATNVLKRIEKVFTNSAFRKPILEDQDTDRISLSNSVNRTIAEYMYLLFKHNKFLQSSDYIQNNIGEIEHKVRKDILNNIDIFQQATGNRKSLEERITLINDFDLG